MTRDLNNLNNLNKSSKVKVIAEYGECFVCKT